MPKGKIWTSCLQFGYKMCRDSGPRYVIGQANWFLLCVLFVRSFGEKRFTAAQFHRVTLSPLAAISIRLSIRKCRSSWMDVVALAWLNPWCGTQRIFNSYQSTVHGIILLFGTGNRLRYRMLGVLVALGAVKCTPSIFIAKNPIDVWMTSGIGQFTSIKPNSILRNHIFRIQQIFFFPISSKIIKMSVSGWLNSWWARTQHEIKINLNIKEKKDHNKIVWCALTFISTTIKRNWKETNQKCTTASARWVRASFSMTRRSTTNHFCSIAALCATWDTMKNRWI